MPTPVGTGNIIALVRDSMLTELSGRTIDPFVQSSKPIPRDSQAFSGNSASQHPAPKVGIICKYFLSLAIQIFIIDLRHPEMSDMVGPVLPPSEDMSFKGSLSWGYQCQLQLKSSDGSCTEPNRIPNFGSTSITSGEVLQQLCIY